MSVQLKPTVLSAIPDEAIGSVIKLNGAGALS